MLCLTTRLTAVNSPVYPLGGKNGKSFKRNETKQFETSLKDCA
jgi:hypothetical protein